MRSPVWEKVFPIRRRSRAILFIMAAMSRSISETDGSCTPVPSGPELRRSRLLTGALSQSGGLFKRRTSVNESGTNGHHGGGGGSRRH